MILIGLPTSTIARDLILWGFIQRTIIGTIVGTLSGVAAVDAAIRLPMRPGARSLNVALAAAMTLGEALRQTDALSLGLTGD